ncbi:hypothetical protein STAS_00876 [Striga asiatica]|uniref:TRF2/HOY1 PH-like domain-containing protein n=1 Tax=Striga asiatica TaxID=4170 RepID=A0A5A7NXR9_STRAF|nr:hypothetical protein STAS_00876 [Striga asiatica]
MSRAFLLPQYVSTYEGDLVAKCYFAKHKLVWEVLECGLKSKIEIQWSDIMALKAESRPTFFREINPQPKKHTLSQATTDGQASFKLSLFSPLLLQYSKLVEVIFPWFLCRLTECAKSQHTNFFCNVRRNNDFVTVIMGSNSVIIVLVS